MALHDGELMTEGRVLEHGSDLERGRSWNTPLQTDVWAGINQRRKRWSKRTRQKRAKEGQSERNRDMANSHGARNRMVSVV